jgi:hypothetical protein
MSTSARPTKTQNRYWGDVDIAPYEITKRAKGMEKNYFV